MRSPIPSLAFWAFFGLLLSSFASASYITVSTSGAPFDVNETFFIAGMMKTDAGVDANHVDVNITIKDATGAIVSNAYLGDRNGSYFTTTSLANAGDYNVIVQDLNNNASAILNLDVLSANNAGITFVDHAPPFQPGEIIRFKLSARDSNNVDLNAIGLLVRLRNGAGSLTGDQNSVVTDRNSSNNPIVSITAPSSTGNFVFDVNNGLSTFSISIDSFRVFVTVEDANATIKERFGSTEDKNVVVRIMNLDANKSLSADSVPTVSIKSPGATTATSLSGEAVGSKYTFPISSAVASSSGEYRVLVTAAYGGTSRTVNAAFFISGVRASMFPKKFSGGGGGSGAEGVEKQAGIYPANTSVNFEAHYVNTSTGQEYSGTDLNSNFCAGNRIRVTLVRNDTGSKTSVSPTVTLGDSNNYCQIAFTTPSTQATYQVMAEADVNSEIIQSGTSLVVQNYFVFLNPVNPSSYDPNNPTGTFDFYKGERIGFQPNLFDLNGQLSPRVTAVRSGKYYVGSKVVDINAVDLNWNVDKNIVTIESRAFNEARGGFVPVTLVLTVNTSNASLDANVTAFGAFKLESLNITVEPASNLAGTTKGFNFGPPSYKANENVFLKVTVKDGANNALAGATVRLDRLFNIDNFSESSVSSIQSKVTDGNGIAVLDLNTSVFSKSVGGYFGMVYATTSDGNTVDSEEAFFMVRNFIIDARPVMVVGGQCQFNPYVRRNVDGNFLVRGFDPSQSFGGGDINVGVNAAGAVNVYYFGTPTKPMFPPAKISFSSYTVTKTSCPNEFNPQGPSQDVNIVTVSPPAGGWGSGFYDISIRGFDTNTESQEIGRGFMQVQSFLFRAVPGSGGGFDFPTAKPGGTFDLNVLADADVNVTAALIDMRTFTKVGNADINIGLAIASDCNAASCPGDQTNAKRQQIKRNQATPSDYNFLRVLIPSGIPMQQYLIQLTATNASGESAVGEVPVQMQAATVVQLSFGTQIKELGPNDGNVEFPSQWIRNNLPTNFTPTHYIQANSFDPNNIDFNFLIDMNRRLALPDLDKDQNFSDETAVGVGQDFNAYRVLDVSTIGTNKGFKFLALSQLGAKSFSMGGYAGDYPADANNGSGHFTVPVLIKDANGSPMGGARVIVTNLYFVTPGSFFPVPLSATSSSACSNQTSCLTSDFNAYAATADVNGLALPVIQISKTGSMMQLELEIRALDGTLQKLQPFQGPTINVLGLSAPANLTTSTFTVDYNVTPTFPEYDLNGAGGSSFLVGIFNEGGIISRNVNFDNNYDQIWYFVRVDGNSVVVLDDKNYAVTGMNTRVSASAAAANFSYQTGSISAAGSDSNAFDSNVIIYGYPNNPGDINTSYNGSNGMGARIAVKDLNNNALGTAVSFNRINIMNFSTFSVTPVSTTNYQSVTGTTRIPLGTLTPGNFNIQIDVNNNGKIQRAESFINMNS